ncbi:MAG: hypothetical protein LW862_14310 [Rubrivivax sp.]|jgi:hypothetical protein|nr:hypothetical protein [Rubrivivax sp.]
MFKISLRHARLRGLALAVAGSAAGLVHAQNAPGRAERADPLDAKAPVPAATYASPLAGYRRLGDDKRVSWKDANETVNRIGGWRVYTREAQQPGAAGSAPAAGAVPAPAAGAAPAHGGHKKH